MNPSESTVSDLLIGLKEVSEKIDTMLLIGEKVECINEGGELYNHLRRLVTPPYFTDEEYKWICELGNSWNNEIRSHDASCGESKGLQTNQEVLDELTDSIEDILNDIDGMDGGDGVW
jgi:hypothetical protein